MENQDFEKPSKAIEKLDDKWYRAFEQIGSFQAYEYLDGNKDYRLKQKADFLEGKIENPNLDYPKINLEELKKKEQELRNLRREVKNTETNPTVSQLYRWRINEKIAELEMLQATATGKMRNFRRYSDFIYGKPSPEIFIYTIQAIRSELEKHLKSADPDVQNIAEELDKILPDLEEGAGKIPLPGDETVQTAQQKTMQELGVLLDIPKTKESFDTEEIKEAFESALGKLESKGWEVVIDTTSKTGISVDQEKMQVKIPESRKLLFNKLKTLVAHEIGTHVARRIKGERNKLMLLGLGLDRYEKGEEGIATMREQAIVGEVKDFAGLLGHLSIGLAVGIDGTPRDFREVYNVLEKYFTLNGLAKGKNLSEAKSEAQNNAWNRCVRTFRGSDCSTKGVCFTKDIIYREGNIGVWDVVGTNPDEMMRFNIGKYDPSNPRHIWILDQLGITEKDLESLESE